jgi:high-affinity iron transporter
VVAPLLLSFREGLEAALIIGVVLGVLKRMRQTGRARVVWLGAGLAALLSLAGGLGLHWLGIAFEGAAEQVFEGAAMLLAAGVLTWMVFWMGRHGRSIRAGLEADVRQAVGTGSDWALFWLAFLTVLREGVELVLFLTAASFTTSAGATLAGGLVGLAAAAVAGWLIFAATTRLDVRAFFPATGLLLILFAAGLVAHGIHEFNEAGWVPSIVEHVWDTNRIIDEESALGATLVALFGYNGNPSLTEVIAYLGYWTVVLLALWRWPGRALAPSVERSGQR